MSSSGSDKPSFDIGAKKGVNTVREETVQAQVLDVRGLLCPMPVIRTQDRVADMAHGSELVVLATDPGTLHDVPAWCRVHGHELIETERVEREVMVRLRVVRSDP